jgi:hypothetical protein
MPAVPVPPIADVIKFLGEHAGPPLLMANVEIN